MKLFAKSSATSLTPKQEAMAGRLAQRLTRSQRRLADWLNGKTSGLSVRTWRLLLVLFCILFGTYCLYLLVAVFI